MKIHNLGFPRIGAKRELKFALEKYWAGESKVEELNAEAARIRETNWQLQTDAGLDLIPAGDFAFYDQVLTTSLLLGVVPKRFKTDKHDLDLEFRIARGKAPTGCACAASDMTKWFDTNYHYIVPELDQNTEFALHAERLLSQIDEAQKSNRQTKPVIIGPVTYLYLSAGDDKGKLAHLSKLLPVYQSLIDLIAEQTDVEWLQIDEPILALELNIHWQNALQNTYQVLNSHKLNLLVATYFGSIAHHTELIKSFANVAGIHIDTVAEPTNLEALLPELPTDWIVSLGVIDGRNIWKADLLSIYEAVAPIYQQLGDKLWLAPSCSLLHSPVDLTVEEKLEPQIKSWLAFAKQKCEELALLKSACISGDTKTLVSYSVAIRDKSNASLCVDTAVQKRLAAIGEDEIRRPHTFEQRKAAQQALLNLPVYPTTTIGSFPQTGDIRQNRAKWRKGELSDEQYQSFIKQEIKDTIDRQESFGLDVLVHGEPERNDMVEYFGEQLNGVAFTQFAWVQSYGSRCVKPPIIYGDVSRKQPMTTYWTEYAQSLTNKPVKAMLTGPITILSWSFIRNDIPRKDVAYQIALAVQDEVKDLEANGSNIIQIDEPAIREAMPVKESQWQSYFDWATQAFRITTANVLASTQIHSHMCYSDFNEILPAIVALDADVLTVETSRSNMALLDCFEHETYPNDLGPGVYDIHSPNVPSVDWIVALLRSAEKYIPKERLWVNPDCGLKTRAWQETEQALLNMVQAAEQLRYQ
ncbi:5-methyltetrahydropteroyltriglutamate--homocysteine S-methyltransferase [Thalassotalea fusca]